VNTLPLLNQIITLCDIDEVSTVFWNPLRLTILRHILENVQGIKFLQYTHHLGLNAFNGSVHIGAFNVEFWLIVSVFVSGATEEFWPVLFVKLLTKNIVHLLAVCCQLSKWVFGVGILCRSIFLSGINWIAGSMSKELVNHDQLWLLTVGNNYKQKDKSNMEWSHSVTKYI